MGIYPSHFGESYEFQCGTKRGGEGGRWGGGGGQPSLTEYNGVTENRGSIVYVVLKTPEIDRCGF